MLDFDKKLKKQDIKDFITSLKSLSYLMDIKYKSIIVYDTMKGHHIYITVENDLSDLDIVFLQLYLGSDKKRELLNYRRVKNDDKNFNVLFEKKYTVQNDKITLTSYEVKNQRLTDMIFNEGIIS
jgi:hypothetical protein